MHNQSNLFPPSQSNLTKSHSLRAHKTQLVNFISLSLSMGGIVAYPYRDTTSIRPKLSETISFNMNIEYGKSKYSIHSHRCRAPRVTPQSQLGSRQVDYRLHNNTRVTSEGTMIISKHRHDGVSHGRLELMVFD